MNKNFVFFCGNCLIRRKRFIPCHVDVMTSASFCPKCHTVVTWQYYAALQREMTMQDFTLIHQ